MKELDKKQIKKLQGLILYTVIVLVLALNYQSVFAIVGRLFKMLLPFLLGAGIAFILNVPMRFVESRIKVREGGKMERLKRPFSLFVSLALVAGVILVVIFIVAPQLAETILSLKDSIPAFFERVQSQAEAMFATYPDIVDYINHMEIDWKTTLENIASFVTTGAGTVLSSTWTAAMSILSAVTTFGIGFIFSMYILLQKEDLKRQSKKLLYAYLPQKAADETVRIAVMAEHIFSKFLTGQCVEAVILGTMFFIVLTIFKLPYALLIGVLIAFTALIPVFGAFIGCAVGIFLTLIINPVQAVWFTIIFFVLQQIEGNLIYPHVVGNSVGLPSIWVLVAVTLGGSMMGVLGMLVFIPLCSVGYALLGEAVNRRLAVKRANHVEENKTEKKKGI